MLCKCQQLFWSLWTWCKNSSQSPTQTRRIATWIYPLNLSSSKNIRAVSEIHLKLNLVEAPTIPVSRSVHGRYTQVRSPAVSWLWGPVSGLLLWSPIWPLRSGAASPSRSLLRGIPPTIASPWWCCVNASQYGQFILVMLIQEPWCIFLRIRI